MQYTYQYSSDGKEYYRLIWCGSSVHIYIPSGLKESLFKRRLIAHALNKARKKRAEKLQAQRDAEEIESQYRSRYPINSSLSDDGIIFAEPAAGGIYIGGGRDSYPETYLTKQQAERFIGELQQMLKEGD